MRFSLRFFTILVLVAGSVVGMALRSYMQPFKVQLFFANGQVSMEWWERRTFDGDTVRLWDRGTIHYYSTGVISAELYSGDERLSKYYSPFGTPITLGELNDYRLRDVGNGTFVDAAPGVNGRPSPLAEEFDRPPEFRTSRGTR